MNTGLLGLLGLLKLTEEQKRAENEWFWGTEKVTA